MIAVIARQQVQSLARQRVFLVTAGILLLMTALAGVIGWSSHDTIVRVYDQATVYLADQRLPAPPNPFDLKPSLSLLSNMVIYIPLIGALLAIVVGYLSLADDETTGIGRLIFTRPVSRSSYVAGKALAVGVVLAATMVACLVVSVAALLAVNTVAPTAAELARLGVFYALSWLYLMAFALVGMVTVLVTNRRPLALLAALGVWLVVTFALPEFTSGLHPVASLNPIVDPVSTSQAFFRVTAKARSLSVFEQYKNASAQILATAMTSETTGHVALRALPLVGAIGGLGAAAAGLVRRHDYSKGTSDV
ncbi:MAG: ABC transporter permease [Acidimicrobiales bacterium]|nr:ABC transporter permease [Acidimicrobiales bacterium]